MFQFLAPFFAGVTKASIGNAILGAGVSAVAGGLSASASGGAQRTTTRTNSTSRTNFQQMRDDAAAAGFNPLTALRMTGGAGNVTTTGNQTVSAPALSGRAIAARGLASGLNSIGNSISNYDPLIEKRKVLENQLLNAQIKDLGQKKEIEGPEASFLTDKSGHPLLDRDGKKIWNVHENYEVIPQYVQVHDQRTGQVYSIINPELTESGPTEVATGLLTITAAKAASEAGISAEVGSFQIHHDPMDFRMGYHFPNGNNATFAYPEGRYAPE